MSSIQLKISITVILDKSKVPCDRISALLSGVMGVVMISFDILAYLNVLCASYYLYFYNYF